MSEEEQRAELRRFLKDRRARIGPAEVGLPTTPRRRVRGLRREEVASLAGIGVSWYTSLENGDADGVTEATLFAVAAALRLSESERQYLMALAGRLRAVEGSDSPSSLIVEAMNAISFPAYIITATWDVVECNDAFRRIWGLGDQQVPFNAIDRLFIEPAARKMHGHHFAENIAPVVAMVHSALGRRPNSEPLRRLRDRLVSDDAIRKIWDEYEISSPFTRTVCTIVSPLGTFRYETLTLPVPGASHGLVVQVPDETSRKLLTIDRS